MTPSLPAPLQARLPCRGRAPVGCHEGEEGRNSGSETGTTIFTLRGEEEFQKNSRRIPCSPVSTGEGRQGTERRGECVWETNPARGVLCTPRCSLSCEQEHPCPSARFLCTGPRPALSHLGTTTTSPGAPCTSTSAPKADLHTLESKPIRADRSEEEFTSPPRFVLDGVLFDGIAVGQRLFLLCYQN